MLLTDKLCGIYLSSAVAMALVNRARTGKGQGVTVPMFQNHRLLQPSGTHVEGDLVDAAVEFALAKLPAGQELPLASDSLLDSRGFDFAARRAAIPEDARTECAQEAAIDAVEAATGLGWSARDANSRRSAASGRDRSC